MKITKRNICIIFGIAILLNAFFVPGIALAKENETNNLEKVDIDKETLRHNEYLNKFDTVTTNPNHVIKSFKDDKKVKLTLSGKKLDIKLHEVSIVNDDAKLLFKNESGIYGKEIPEINTYQGKVIDNKDSDVTLTVSNNVMVGSIDVGNETYIIDQTNKEKNGKVIHVSYKSSDIKESNKSVSQIDIQENVSFKTSSPRKSSLQTTDSLSDTLTTSSTTTIDFLPSYDSEFNNMFSTPETEIANMINEIDDFAYDDAGITLQITSYKQFNDVPQGNSSEILDFFDD